MSICNVNLTTGDVYHYSVDFTLRGLVPLTFIRDYDSSRTDHTAVGRGWRHNRLRVLLLNQDGAVYLTAEGREIQVPHPDLTQSEVDPIRSWREGDSVVISDRLKNLLRFESIYRADRRLYLTSTTDPHGTVIRYHYDSHGLASLIDAYDRTVVFAADDSGHIGAVILHHPDLPEGGIQVTQYEYDVAGRLRRVRGRNGGLNEFRYEDHLLVEHINPLGGRTYFRYDSKHRCIDTFREGGVCRRTFLWEDEKHSVQVTDSRGATWNYVLTDKKQPRLEMNPSGVEREYIYDDQGNLQYVSEKDAPQKISLFFAERGLLLEQVGEMTRTVEFDDKMRVVKRTSPAGSTWVYAYDEQSNRIRAIDPRKHLWRFQYDSDGWLNTAVDPRGFHVSRTRLTLRDVEYRDELGRLGIFHYTPLGYLTALEDASEDTVRLDLRGVDQLTQIVNPDGTNCRLTYDAMGNVTAFIDETGATASFTYSAFGAPLRVTDALGFRATYEYDSEDNLVQVTNQKGEIASFEYDLARRPISVRLFDGSYQAYHRDARGNVLRITDWRDEVVVNLEYDQFGRVQKKIYPSGWEVNFAWGDQSQLLSVSNPESVLKIDWTPDLTIAAQHVDDFSIEYAYDQVGNRKSLTTSTGRTIQYLWDPRNRLKKIVDVGKAEYEFTYSDVDLFREWTCPAILERYEFDNRYRMTRRTVLQKQTNELILQRQYRYDRRSSLSQTGDLQRGSFSYSFSPLGEIIQVRSENGRYSEMYRYDETGNLTTNRDVVLEYGPGDRLRRSDNDFYDYDEGGRVIAIDSSKDGRRRLKYNPEGRLSVVVEPDGKKTEYRYDPLGRRISKNIEGGVTRFHWDLNVLLTEAPVADDPIEYLFLPQTFLPLGFTSGARHYSFVLDQAGTPTEIVDDKGSVVWAGDYSAFGELISERSNPLRNPFRFQGQYFDEETGFHYNGQRYYLPQCGRYLTPDPLGFRAGGNLYRYLNNPFNTVDPFGLDLLGTVLKIKPICGWNPAQVKEAEKKMAAMNSKLGSSGKFIPKEPKKRCGATAKDIYEDCQKQDAAAGKPVRPNLSETNDKCTNEQADHMLEICAGGGEKDCDNLQPLNESVNKSYGNQVAKAVRQLRAQGGGMITQVVLIDQEEDCTENENVDC